MRVLAIVLLAACSASESGDYNTGTGGSGAASADAGFVGCLSSNECPAGTICNDFGHCEPQPSGSGSGSSTPPPEVEYTFGAPLSSQRYVYVAMTKQDSLARIDGRTLEVTSTKVGEAPKVVATIPGGDGAVVLDSFNGTATVVRPSGSTDSLKVLGTLPKLNRLDIDPYG